MAKRNRREPPPPSKWGRSKNGTYFYVVHTTKRDYNGRKLYRMFYLADPQIKGNQLWTLEDLEKSECRWLKNKPRTT